MGRQRNMSQMEEQEKSLEKDLNEMEASKLPDAEFKTMDISMLDELSENFNSIKKDTGTIKKKWSEMKNTLSGMNNTLEDINSRLDEADD